MTNLMDITNGIGGKGKGTHARGKQEAFNFSHETYGKLRRGKLEAVAICWQTGGIWLCKMWEILSGTLGP